jgi:1-acyl-sn-glycerol-3-phosphate acyltransferase
VDPAHELTSSERLSKLERFHVRFVRRSLEPGWLASCVKWCQRYLGATWITLATRRLLHVHGEDRLPLLDPAQSFLMVANHRTFFDLYAITAHLVRSGLRHRILFPVRSAFFYDHPLGFLINGLMSFFAMYPPIFRERKKLALNLCSLDELAAQLRRGGVLAGIHPEGTRNKGPNPYALLPAQRGTGRVVQAARVPVIPVFVNGLVGDLKAQILNNLAPRKHPIVIVFGAPVPLEDLIQQPESPKVHQAIADRTLAAVTALGEEEQVIRAGLLGVQNTHVGATTETRSASSH